MCYGSPVSDTSPDHGPGHLARPAKAGPARVGAAQAGHSIGIRELRQHASVYVDLVEKGQTVDITNRGRLVARLVPARDVESPLERLIAAGIIQPAEDPGSLLDIEPAPAVPEGQPTASEVLLKMREEERY